MTSYNAPSGVHEIRGISGLDRPERSEDRTRMGSNPCHPTQKGHPLGWPYIMRLQGFEPWTNRLRVYCSTNWAKGAYFCFSVFHWMIHSLNTNKIIKDSAEKSNLFFTVSLLLLKTAKTGLIILLNFTIFSYISVCFDDGSNGSRTYFRFLSFFFKSFSSSCMDFWIL